MKKLFLSMAAVFVLTAVLLIAIWSVNDEGSANETSSLSTETSYDAQRSDDYASIDNDDSKCEIGALFSRYKDIVDGGVYKLVITRQKRFGGNSVPVKTTTYYGEDFINIVEEEGHGLANEIFINGGVYCFDSSTGMAHFMPDLVVEPDRIATEGICYMENGEATVGLASLTYERYKTKKGYVIDYLFAGEELKKMKIYNGSDYELLGVEIYTDISGARTEIPDDVLAE